MVNEDQEDKFLLCITGAHAFLVILCFFVQVIT